MDRTGWLAEKKAEIEQLAHQRLTEVAPSRRDFTLFIGTDRQTVALIPRLARTAVTSPGGDPAADLVALARTCDEADAPAIAVATASLAGGSIDDLRLVSEAVSAAVLRDDLCLDSNHLYQARLHGADAVILPLADLEREPLDTMVRLAASLHMTAILEVTGASDLPAAVAVPRAVIGLRTVAGWDAGESDRVKTLAQAIPRQRTVLLLDDLPTLDAVRELTGVIDAALVGNVLLERADLRAVLAPP